MEKESNESAVEKVAAAKDPRAKAPTTVRGGILRFRRRRPVMLTVLIVVVVLGVGWSWWLFGRDTSFNENQNVNKNEFQAIFLTNGQVYFGKLSDLNNKYVTLTDIYYLQVQKSNSLQGASSSTDTNSQVSLAKLGSELHGPEDKMHVASDQVLFWENLKSNSKVVQAIEKYQGQ